MLDQHGAAVVGPAATVSEALKAVNENQIDCALLDLKLGDETADPVVVALVQRAIRTVLVTAYDDGHLPPGFENYPRIEKPYKEHQLLRLVVSIFDQT
jgi:hypothetical protein